MSAELTRLVERRFALAADRRKHVVDVFHRRDERGDGERMRRHRVALPGSAMSQ